VIAQDRFAGRINYNRQANTPKWPDPETVLAQSPHFLSYGNDLPLNCLKSCVSRAQSIANVVLAERHETMSPKTE
jgi:hypothetical protein